MKLFFQFTLFFFTANSVFAQKIELRLTMKNNIPVVVNNWQEDDNNFFATVINNTNKTYRAKLHFYTIGFQGSKKNILLSNNLPILDINRGSNFFGASTLLPTEVFPREIIVKGDLIIGLEMEIINDREDLGDIKSDMKVTNINNRVYAITNDQDQFVSSFKNKLSTGISKEEGEMISKAAQGIKIEQVYESEGDEKDDLNFNLTRLNQPETSKNLKKNIEITYTKSGSFILNQDFLNANLIELSESVDPMIFEVLDARQTIFKLKLIVDEIENIQSLSNSYLKNNAVAHDKHKSELNTLNIDADASASALKAEQMRIAQNIYVQIDRSKKIIRTTKNLQTKLHEIENFKSLLLDLIKVKEAGIVTKKSKNTKSKTISYIGN